MRVWLSFQTEEALHCVENNSLHKLQGHLYLMTIYCSISDSTSVTAVC